MVGAVVGAGQAMKEALSIAGDIAKRGPLAVRAAKLAIDEGMLEVCARACRGCRYKVCILCCRKQETIF